ncbi:hypothetical protein [Orenia metallireducens]|nr:hypothetical protein [Orenia metallireducens]
MPLFSIGDELNMDNNKVVGLFHQEEEAKKAVEAIKELGIDEGKISLVVKQNQDDDMEAGEVGNVEDKQDENAEGEILENSQEVGTDAAEIGGAGQNLVNAGATDGALVIDSLANAGTGDAGYGEKDMEVGELGIKEDNEGNENGKEADMEAGGLGVAGEAIEKGQALVDGTEVDNYGEGNDIEADYVGTEGQNLVDGTALGGALGGAAGLLAGAGLLAIPGLGPVLAAGPIAAGLAGLAAGGVAGGLIDYGIDQQDGERYGAEIEKGKVLVAVEDDDEERLNDIAAKLKESGAYDIANH